MVTKETGFSKDKSLHLNSLHAITSNEAILVTPTFGSLKPNASLLGGRELAV